MSEGFEVNLDFTTQKEKEATQSPNLMDQQETPLGSYDNPLGLSGTSWAFLDGDTVRDSTTGKSVRLRGIDTRETAKYLRDSGFKEGELGGDAAASYISSLASKHGFTNVVTTGEKGEYDREIGDILDKDGNSFVDTLIKTGVVSPSRFSSKEDVDLALLGIAKRDLKPSGEPLSDWDNARQAIYEAETEQYGGLPINKLIAFDAAEYQANPDLYMGIKQRVKGADYEGRSRTPFGTGFDIGFATLYKSLNTLGATIANRVGASEIEASFAADAEANQRSLELLPTLKTDVTQIDWTSFDEAATGALGMLGTSLPFMGATITGMAAAPFTSGTSMAIPVSVYTGMVLDEMEGSIEDKSLTVAVFAGAAMTALDRIGLKGLVSPSQMITKEGREAVIDGIAKKRYRDLSPADAKKAASKEFIDLTKKEMLTFVDDAKEFAASQIQKGHLFREGVKRLSRASASEGATEALQELTQYTAAVIGSEKEWDYNEVEHLMTNAIVAGGLMGSTFAVPGVAIQTGNWKSAGDFYGEDDGRFDNFNTSVLNELEEEYNGEVPTIDEFNRQNAEAAKNKPKGTPGDSNTVNDMADQHNPPATTAEFLQAFVRNPMVAVRHGLMNTYRKAKGKSPTLAIIVDSLGSSMNRVVNGVSMEQDQQLKMASFDSVMRKQEQIEASFDMPLGLSSAQRSKFVSDLAYRFYKQVLEPSSKSGKEMDWSKADKDLVDNKEALLMLNKDLQGLGYTLLEVTNKARNINGEGKVNTLINWSYRHKSFRREYIAKNRDRFSELLQKEYKMSKVEADNLTDSIINNESVSTLGDAFDVTKGGVNPSLTKERKLHISDRPAFDDFLEQNIFKNMGDASRETARFSAHRTYLGKDMSFLGMQLEKVQAELERTMEPEEARKLVNEIAYDLRNFINAESGNYNVLHNQTLKQGQKYLTLLTTIQHLSLAAVASIVEMPMIVQGVPREVIVKNAATQGYLFGGAVGSYLRNLMSISRVAQPREEMETFLDKKLAELRGVDDTDPRFMFYTNMKELLGQTGFKSQETGAATTTGVQETNEMTRSLLDAFFKANFLHDQQDMHRMMRLSFFNDFFIDKLDLISQSQGEVDTVGVAEAKKMFRELGIPTNLMIRLGNKLKNNEPLTDAETETYKREFLNGANNFVTQAIPLPSAFNRPLFYSDPRFALLTQFNGFTSTFTANQLPRLWNQISKGSKGLQYGTVATMSNMLILAFLSQGIKDELKYGEESPYLTDNQKIQRAIYSSGLLGTPERVISSNLMFPLYGSDTYGVGDFVWENVAGEAAASSTIGRLYNMVDSAIEGEGDKFERNLYKSLPFAGPFSYRLQNITWE